MHLIDWILVFGSLFIVLVVGLYTQQYMKSVADFMSAGRVARRYLLAVSKDEMTAGAVMFVAAWEVTSHSGFTLTWWTTLFAPIPLVIAIAGFVVYRYRETRAMTLGQFFEIRYSKRFRLFTGFLAFFAGLLNFGIIPAVGARAMVYLFGLPPEVHLLGAAIQTYIPLMALFLLVNLIITTTGGIITIMMTNCIEGILSQIFYLVLIFGLLSMFKWTDIIATLSDRPAHQSLLNPMDSSGLKDFNAWYVLMSLIMWTYGTMTWQNQSAYQSAPLNAHEGRMGGLLGRWRSLGKGPVIVLLALCAMAYLHQPQFAAGAAAVQTDLAGISNPQIREQMQIPVTLTHLLPTGMRGALCAILILGILGGDSCALHSWGGLFIQDVILPLRKRPFTPEQHIRLLRFSIAGVALFAFVFGALLDLADYVQMWWNITQSVFVGGAGAATIGGLYWKRGTAAGAWAGMLTGSILSVAGIVVKQAQGHHLVAGAGDFYANHLRPFPGVLVPFGQTFVQADHFIASYNYVQISFVVMLCAVSLYVGVSLLTWKEDFNMDRMLHRGAYAAVISGVGEPVPQPRRRRIDWGKIIGYDNHFTRGDKWIAGGLFGWSMMWLGIVIFVLTWNYFRFWSVDAWAHYYYFTVIGVGVFFALTVGTWLTWGGISDSIALFQRLRWETSNPLDNGAVVNHQNLDETARPEEKIRVRRERDESAEPIEIK
jgi:SSS family solute:Na+ symporter